MASGVSARGIKAGAAYVELLTDDSAMMRGLKRAQLKLKAFGESISALGKKMMALGAAVAAPMALAAKHFSDVGSDLFDMSARTGLSTNALSELGYAASQTGSDLTTLEGGIKRMQKGIFAAAGGSKEQVEAFQQLGLSVEQLKGMNPEQQFETIAERIAAITDPTTQAAMAMKLFGKSGTSLLPMMNDMKALRAEAVRLGASISPEMAAAADALGDAWVAVKTTVGGVANAVGFALTPLLTNLADKAIAIIPGITQWINANRELVVQIFGISVGVLAAGAAIWIFGQGFIFAASCISGLMTVCSVLAPIVAGMVAVFSFLVSPIGLTTMPIAALGAAILYFTGAGGAALTWFSQQWQTLKDATLETVQGIGNALLAGNIQLAADILWASLKLAWAKGTGWLKSLWSETVFSFESVFTACGYGLRTAWQETQSFLAKGFTTLGSVFENIWNTCVATAEKAWNRIQGFFDSSVNADALNAAVDEKLAAKQADLATQTNEAIAAIEGDRKANKTARDTTYNKNMAAASEKQTASETALQKELNDLVKERTDLLDQAAKERADAERNKTGLYSSAQKLPSFAMAMSGPMSSVGTFSGAAASLMGRAGSGAGDKIAENTKLTAENTGKIVDKLDDVESLKFE